MKEFTIDSDGVPRAQILGDNAIIGWLLEQDIQSSQNLCQEYIRELASVRDNPSKTWEATGNAFTVIADGAQCRVEAEYFDYSQVVSVDCMLAYLAAWGELLAASDS
jgi:uncharacterized protein YacL (UPF0231 family)